MSQLLDVQEPGDIVYTMRAGVMRAWKVTTDGDLQEIPFRGAGGYTPDAWKPADDISDHKKPR